MNKNKIVITTGDYNGIGVEIIIKALQNLHDIHPFISVIGNKKIFEIFQQKHGLKLPDTIEVLDIPFDVNDYRPGKESAAAGEFSFRCLEHACKLAKKSELKAIVTAPVSKNALHLAGHNFSGQTEVLEKFLAHDGQKAEMLFCANNFRVLLLTRHIPLCEVKIDKELIVKKVLRLQVAMKNNFKIEEPSFAICALNPHAGENGVIGTEEIREFQPAIRELRSSGLKINGPFPADTLFAGAAYDFKSGIQSYDCYIACYHDQGLIPIKTLAMDECVNTTIGLDILRTSPAHGTAYDIAGFCCARPDSMEAAITAAIKQNYS